jgi:coenzyme F420 hydrogenase subunit beta
MSLIKISFEESLAAHVVNAGRCLGCGACILVCPFNCLVYKDEKPSLVKECPACGMCARICPQYEEDESKIESLVFGRERKAEEEFGIYRRLVVARANDERIQQVCQDGGAVTALLSFALKEGLIDYAVVAGVNPEKPFSPRPELAFTVEEILKSAGAKYSYSPNVLALSEVIRQKKSNVAFVGTPCHVRAIRKMQMAGLKKYCNSLKFIIGLMCSECFTYEGLMTKHIHERLGINLSDIRKINIKGKMLVSTASEVRTIPLADIKQYARKSCSFCHDFSSELADISAGGLGLDGWTFIVVRTDKGDELFSSAEKARAITTRSVDEEANALNLLRRLSVKERQR